MHCFFYLVVKNMTQACKMSCSSAKMRNPWAARQCDHFMASVYARKSAGALYEKEASQLPSEKQQRQAIAEGVHSAKAKVVCLESLYVRTENAITKGSLDEETANDIGYEHIGPCSRCTHDYRILCPKVGMSTYFK